MRAKWMTDGLPEQPDPDAIARAARTIAADLVQRYGRTVPEAMPIRFDILLAQLDAAEHGRTFPIAD